MASEVGQKSVPCPWFLLEEGGSMYKQTAYPVINLAETGRCIERQRRQAGLTVRDLQTYFGFEYPQAIYKWQHGECLPTVDNLLALARLLQVSMEDLLVYEDQGVSHFIRIILQLPTPETGQCFHCNFFKSHKIPGWFLFFLGARQIVSEVACRI